VEITTAQEMATTAELDLVEVAPNAAPPVCRIIDYGKFVYQQTKRAHEAKKKQKVSHLKEIKIGPSIDDHDLFIKLNHARDFLQQGDKLKITMRFRGREMRLQDKGMKMLGRVTQELDDVGNVENPPKKEGRQIYMVLGARTKKKGN